jgi:hypothetical protein
VDEARNTLLIIGAALSALAAALHLGCIFFGASWYRFFGAGERMAQLAAAGSLYPTLVTLVITAALTTASLYALAGAGVISDLPFVRAVLCAITAVYLLRGVAGVALSMIGLGRSVQFWWWSSAICIALGVVHFIGLRQVWNRL